MKESKPTDAVREFAERYEKRITNLVLAVGSLSMAVAYLARLCDVRGHVFDAETAKRFDSHWDMCQEMLADALKEERDD